MLARSRRGSACATPASVELVHVGGLSSSHPQTTPGHARVGLGTALLSLPASLHVACAHHGRAIQGRQLFLRISSLLQFIAFTTLFAGYLLVPSLESIPALTNISNQRLLDCLPSYWLLGLFQQLNGTMRPAFVPLAERGWIALAIAFLSAVALLLLAWVMKLRRVVEQPDIVPRRPANGRLLSFGTAVSTALLQFSVRSLLRSRQHRLLYAF